MQVQQLIVAAQEKKTNTKTYKKTLCNVAF